MSAALHAALLVLAVRLSRAPEEPAADRSQADASDTARQVQMVYLPPPPVPRVATDAAAPPPPQPTPPPPPPPPQPVPRIAPPPEKEQRTPEPDANAPPEAERRAGDEPTNDDPAGGEKVGADAKRRLTGAGGGQRGHDGVRGEADLRAAATGPAARAPGRGRAGRWRRTCPIIPSSCVPKEPEPTDSAREPQFGTVMGKIYRQDSHEPLAGAHLQMLGTPFVTFTDGNGEYRFRFDLALVDNCRTQYVRVTAPGYESRLLVLMVGQNIRSDDVLLKKK